MPKHKLLWIPALLTLCCCASALQRDRLPNLPLPTLGGLQLWTDVQWSSGWRIQENSLTGHHRLLDHSNIRRAWGSKASCDRKLASLVERRSPERLVVLVHGLGRTRNSWRALGEDLEQAQIPHLEFSYSSTRIAPAEAALRLESILNGQEGLQRVDFVTHSLGALVVRELLARPAPWRTRCSVQQVICLAPPHQGSTLARRLTRSWLTRVLARGLLGESFEVLSRKPQEVAPPLESTVDALVIAATRGRAQGYNALLPGDDDGVVNLVDVYLAGSELKRVHGLHTFIQCNPQARHLILGRLLASPN